MTNKILSLFDKRLLSLKSQVIFEKQESDIVAVLLIDKWQSTQPARPPFTSVSLPSHHCC